MDRMSSILHMSNDGCLNLICCLLCFQAAVFCYFLFSKRHFVLRASLSDDLTGRESHPDSYLYLYLSFCVCSTNNAKECKYVW